MQRHPNTIGGLAEWRPPTLDWLDSLPAVREDVRRQTLGHQYGDVMVKDRGVLVQGNVVNINAGTLDERERAKKVDALLASLPFERMDARLRNVAPAMPRTCQWLFELPQVRSWTYALPGPRHKGFLWLKGKPGCGKSTIMKEALQWAEKEWKTDTTLSYFFNARSPSTLEKSTLGLCRSLVHQLISARKELIAPFLAHFSNKESNGIVQDWTAMELQNFIASLLTDNSLLGTVNIFIDALDEGADEEVRDLISFLDDIAEKAHLHAMHTVPSFPPLRICLSSRHYPYISVRHGVEIVVEDEAAHNTDIATYIGSKLPQLPQGQLAELRHRMSTQSAGVFLWVVLVVPMITSIHDRGRGFAEMMRKLDEIPTRLHDLFNDILDRDELELDTCIRLLQWVLFSKRSLTVRELYVGVYHDLVAMYKEDIDFDAARIARFVLNNSRGLVELTKTDPPNVQFIHETVRTYLLNHYRTAPSGNRQVPATATEILPFTSDNADHAIARVCLQYLLSIAKYEDLPPARWLMATGWSASLCEKRFPLAEYAACFWWEHLKTGGVSPKNEMCTRMAQTLIDNSRAKNLWLCLLLSHYSGGVNPLHPDDPGYYTQPSERKVFTLPDTIPWEFADLGPSFHCAVMTGIPGLVTFFIEKGVDVNLPGFDFGSPLAVAAYCGHDQIAHILLEAGADVHGSPAWRSMSPLQTACHRGHIGIAETLLRYGASPRVGSPSFDSTVFAAAGTGMHSIVKQILADVPDIRPRDAWYVRALITASVKGRTNTVSVLLEAASELIWHSSFIDIAAMAVSEACRAHVIQQRASIEDVVKCFSMHVPLPRRRDLVRHILSDEFYDDISYCLKPLVSLFGWNLVFDNENLFADEHYVVYMCRGRQLRFRRVGDDFERIIVMKPRTSHRVNFLLSNLPPT